MTKLKTSDRIDEMLGSLSIDQRLGQLLHPFVRPHESSEEITRKFSGIEPGGVFVFPGTIEETRRCVERIQSLVSVPAVISSDLENGAGRMLKDATIFPDFMALAAVNDEKLAYDMGRAAAVEGRSAGIHWAFGPVVDINAEWRNPITNTRSLGDDPETISRLARRFIAGMQDHGMSATAKHFPGDGFDDRDQHVCTTVNPLSMDEWRRLGGRVFKETIDDGVWSIMIGHIALPAWDPGNGDGAFSAPPATLSRRLTTDLLRGELGFEGLIVSDATGMGGMTSWGDRETIVPQCVMAGNDMVLFCNVERDFRALKQAMEDGRLTMQRVDEAVRRILAFKERLGILDNPEPRALRSAEVESFRRSAADIAERAPTLVRASEGSLPIDLSPGRTVMSVHFRGDPLFGADQIDDLLRARGADVRTYKDWEDREDPQLGWPSDAEVSAYHTILVNVTFGPSWCTNRIRPLGNFLRFVIDRLPIWDGRVIFISYGTPYLLRDLPRIANLINAYSPDRRTQEAVIRILTGELKARGVSPVNVGA